MQTPRKRWPGKRLLQIGIPLALFLWLGWKLWNDWQQASSFSFSFNAWLLGLSFLGFSLQVLTYGVIWRFVLRRLGVILPLPVSLRIYLASEFVRYIPGNIWHVLTRILWVGKYGVSRSLAFTSMVIELITKLAAGALVCLLSLPFWSQPGSLGQFVQEQWLWLALAALGLLVLLACLHPRILTTVLNCLLALLKKEPITLQVRYSDILLTTLYWCVSWCIAGIAFYVMMLAIWPQAPLQLLPVAIGIYAFVWDIGFLSVITPSGLGVREWAMTVLFVFAFPLPGALVSLLAILSRIVSTLAELLCVGVAYGYGLRRADQPLPGHVSEQLAPTVKGGSPE